MTVDSHFGKSRRTIFVTDKCAAGSANRASPGTRRGQCIAVAVSWLWMLLK